MTPINVTCNQQRFGGGVGMASFLQASSSSALRDNLAQARLGVMYARGVRRQCAPARMRYNTPH